jgi:hypothetical protein
MNRLVLVAIAALTALAAACGNTASPSPFLSDPKAIVQASLDAAQIAHTVHLDVRVDGTAKVSLPGTGAPAGSGTPVKVDGTTASVDVDFDKPALHATIAVPAIFNFTADVIAIGGNAYIKSSLTGPLYQESQGSGPIDPAGTRGLFQAMETAIQQPGVTLTKGADAQCGRPARDSERWRSHRSPCRPDRRHGRPDAPGRAVGTQSPRRDQGRRDVARRNGPDDRRDGLEMERAGLDQCPVARPGEAVAVVAPRGSRGGADAHLRCESGESRDLQ